MFDAVTRRLCEQALSGHWAVAMETEPVAMDDVPGFSSLSPARQAAVAVARVARMAPLRLTDGELLAGATTLAEAMNHHVPATFGGRFLFPGVSHTTPDLFRLVTRGLDGMMADVAGALAGEALDEAGRDHARALAGCLAALGTWARRYRQAVAQRVDGAAGETRQRWLRVQRALARVPEQPAATFHEALQALWLAFCFLRLNGNWPGIGRVDRLLEPYYQADVAAGRITGEQARELLAHFWIKGAEWAGGIAAVTGGTVTPDGSGDAQFYQNVVLAGCDEQGCTQIGEVTYLILDMVAELKISDFPIAVRLGRQSPDRLLDAVGKVVQAGNGIIAVYNEERVIENLIDFGYPPEHARNFANDGCWEVILPGETCFGYYPFDMLAVLQGVLGVRGGEVPDFEDFDSLYVAFLSAFEQRLDEVTAAIGERIAAEARMATPLIDLFVDDCLTKGRCYYDGGARYRVLSPHAGGLPDTANCLTILKRMVFEDKRVPLADLIGALRDNWAGRDLLRREIDRTVPLYGNDDREADAMAARVLGDFITLCHARSPMDGALLPPGVSTFGREMSQFGPGRGATALGPADRPLATNFSPTPGTDALGPTAVVRSHCRVNLQGLTNGTALELKLLPASVAGETGRKALTALMKTFVEEGGIFVQFDMVDTQTLLEAQRHPDHYPRLAVRVAGWSARFNTLSKPWQDLVIARTQQGL